METILKAEKISKLYNHTQVLNQVDFIIERKKIYIIKGKSGSGKSTLLNILSSLEKPDSGEIIYKAKRLHNLNDQQQSAIRGKDFGFIFQNYNLIPEFTVKQNILLPLIINKLPIDRQTLSNLVEHLNIKTILNRKIHFLSGGEQQRVAIARAFIKKPKIIFADEPTGNLDQKNTDLVVELFSYLVKKEGVSLVVVTHEQTLFEDNHQEYELKNGFLREI